jgi:DNA polymerase-3 subunit beta
MSYFDCGKITIHERYIVFLSENCTIISYLIDQKYPDFLSIIPKDNPISVSMSNKDVLSAMKILKMFVNKSTNKITLSIKKDKAIFKAEDIDMGLEKEITINCNATEEIAIGFDCKLLESILKESKDFNMKLSTPNRGVIINDNFLLMPILL